MVEGAPEALLHRVAGFGPDRERPELEASAVVRLEHVGHQVGGGVVVQVGRDIGQAQAPRRQRRGAGGRQRRAPGVLVACVGLGAAPLQRNLPGHGDEVERQHHAAAGGHALLDGLDALRMVLPVAQVQQAVQQRALGIRMLGIGGQCFAVARRGLGVAPQPGQQCRRIGQQAGLARPGGDGAVVGLHRLVHAVQRLQRVGAVGQGIRQVRCQSQRLVVAGQGFGGALQFFQRAAPGVQCFGVVGAQRQRAVVGGQRLAGLLQVVQQQAERELRLGVVGPPGQRLADGGERLLQPAQAAQRHGLVVQRLRMAGLPGQRAGVAVQRGLGLAQLALRVAAVDQRFHVVGLAGQRALVACQRILRPTQLPQRDAHVVEQRRQPWPELVGLLQKAQSFGGVLALQVQQAQQVQGVEAGGLVVLQRTQQGFGLAALALAQQRHGLLQLGGGGMRAGAGARAEHQRAGRARRRTGATSSGLGHGGDYPARLARVRWPEALSSLECPGCAGYSCAMG